jgi:D-inositol-3-phosphate glycosyltransferase
MSGSVKRVALVAPGLQYGGGVPSMALFLYRLLESTGRYEPVLVSLSIAADDPLSVRLLAPSSWRRGVQTRAGSWRGLPVTYVGAFLAEFEFQRFRPRRALAELLAPFDLVQVVAGTPAMGMAAAGVQKPRCLFAATTIRRERASLLAATSGARRLWLRLMTAVNDRSEQRALGLMDHVFALSEYTRAHLAGMVPEFKLSLGVPGVDTELFHPADKSPTHGCILSVGRMIDPRKNVRLLLEAYGRLCERLPDAPRLVLAGGDLPSQDWARAKEWGLADRIEVRLDLTSQELAPLYRQASLFVLPSNEEGLGIVLLEAMASGLPVVSTRCGGPETCVVEGKTGYLTPVGDAEALAGRMQVLLEDETLRQRLGRAGRELVERRFSLQAAGEPFLAVYDRLLGGGGLGREPH